MRHPNVVRVYGAEEHGGRVGVWMELIEGKTLEAEVKDRGTFDADTATDIGVAVCDALSQVHAAGLAHGDITARNVMREGDGRVVLTDFGAARFRVPRTSESSRGLAGTPAYLAPERFDRPEPTVQSDLYSVGVLLFYLVTREYPVRGRSAKELRAAHGSSASMVTLQSLNPDLPDQFARVVERALARSPEHRCLTAAEMRQELFESKPKVEPRITLRQVMRIAAVAAAAAGVVWTLGLVVARTFEVALDVPADLHAAPLRYFTLGLNSLILILSYWLASGVAVGALVGLRALLGSRLESLMNRLDVVQDALDPKIVATAVFFVGATGLAAIFWSYADLFVALDALRAAPDISPHVELLSPASHAHHRSHAMWSGYLSFLLGFAAWRVFPGLERRVADAKTVRLLKWATATLAFVSVVAAAAPWRVIWGQFEVYEYESEQVYVIGSTDAQFLLYDPLAAPRVRGRVSQSDPRLTNTGITRGLFANRDVAD